MPRMIGSQAVGRAAGWATLMLAVLVVTIGPRPYANAAAATGSPSEVVPNRTVPAVAPPIAGFHFSVEPEDDAFLRTGLFAQPLIPVGKTSPKENHDLATTLLAYEAAGRRDAVDAIVHYLDEHPSSAWRPALLVNLGAVYRETGHFSKALETWQSAWDLTKALTDDQGRVVGDVALGYLSQFEAYLGRKETLAPLLEAVRGRPIRGTAAQLVSNSSRGLSEMLERPDVSFKCGPSALSRILLSEGKRSQAAQAVLEAAQSTANGLSLTAVQGISAKAKMNYQMAFRSPGAPVVTPAVVHWKVGHYAALLGHDTNGRYDVGDPTFGDDIRMSGATIDDEASGYALVPPGRLPDGWRPVSAAEGEEVWGRGNTGSSHDDGATGHDEIHAFPCDSPGGCSTWNVEAAVVGLSLHDDPVGYTPPVGPPVRFPVDYSQRDLTQPSVFTYTNLGNRWNLGWLSYVVDRAPEGDACAGFNNITPLSIVGGAQVSVTMGSTPPAECVSLHRRGGGTEPFVFAASGSSVSTTSTYGQFSHTYLQRTTDSNGNTTGFVRMMPDASTETFALKATGSTGGYGTYFMTAVADAQGNQVKLTYDSQDRIVSITDALGQVTRLCYSGQVDSVCQGHTAPSPLEITQVTDPFNRSAFFGYDTATKHLTSITDVLNIQSTFVYTPGTDFIQTLTTPYGSTQFAFYDSTVDNSTSSTRWVKVTDPMNRVSYVEFYQGTGNCTNPTSGPHALVDGNSVTCQELASAVPTGMLTYNQNLQYRNTFIWDPYQYQLGIAASGTNHPLYAFAKTIHWLHTNQNGSTDPTNGDTNPLTASRIPESILPNGNDARIWFSYVNQSQNEYGTAQMVGSSNLPIAVGQVLLATGIQPAQSQVWQYQYNGFGLVTKTIDPVGRTTVYNYDPNNLVDLLTVTNGTAPIATFANYQGHRPQTVTGSNGQTTTVQYNAYGQLGTVTDPEGNSHIFNYCSTTAPCVNPTPTGGYLQSVQATAVPGAPATTMSSLTYDTYGRVLTATDGGGVKLTYLYDLADRPTSVIYPDGTSLSYGYDRLDLVTSVDRKAAITTFHYDADRELYEIDEPLRSTEMTYWPNKVIQTLVDPLKFKTSFWLDNVGRITKRSEMDGTSWIYQTDGNGRLELVHAPNGGGATGPGITIYNYNTDNTLQRIDTFDGTVSFTYDPNYRRLTGWKSVSPTGTVRSTETWTYQPATPAVVGANQLASRTETAFDAANPNTAWQTTLSYGYDELGRVNKQTIQGPVGPGASSGPVQYSETFAYDGLGRLTADVNPLDQFEYIYDDGTPRIKKRASNLSLGGPQVAMSYHADPAEDGLLESITYTGASGVALVDYGYNYDANGNVTNFSKSTPGGSSSIGYVYDPYNQLLTAGTGGTAEGYTYDANGNRTSISLLGGGSITLLNHNNSMNELSSAVGATTSSGGYDNDGNMSSFGTNYQFTYDQRDRLVAADTLGAYHTDFVYDGLGRVIQMVDKVNGSVTANYSYVWCGNRRCLQVDNTRHDNTGSPMVSRVYTSQGFFQGNAGGVPYYYLTDALGSVREVIDDSYPVPSDVADYDYNSVGGASASFNGSGVESDIGFAGYFVHSLTGSRPDLSLTADRVYMPAIGQWVNRDPVGRNVAFARPGQFSAGDLNLYAYAGNNPTTLVDPSGDCWTCFAGVVGFVAGAGYYAFTAPTNLSWGEFAHGAFQYGLASALGATAGAELGIGAAGATPTVVGWLGAGGAAISKLDVEQLVPMTGEEINAVSPRGAQAAALRQLFKTGIDNGEVTNDTLERYLRLAFNTLENEAKNTDVAQSVQVDRIEQIQQILAKRGCQ